jgi:superfamily I DNA/RNA helicase
LNDAETEEFPEAEERLLCYVALTRAKTAAHLIATPFRLSPFVTELLSGQYNVGVNGLTGPSSTLVPSAKQE